MTTTTIYPTVSNANEIVLSLKGYNTHKYHYNAAAESLMIQHEGISLFNLICKNITERNISESRMQDIIASLADDEKIKIHYLVNYSDFHKLMMCAFEVLHTFN